MKHLHNVLVKYSLIAGSIALALAVMTMPLLAQGDSETAIPFSTDEVVTIEAVSQTVGEGELTITESEKPDHLLVSIDGSISTPDGLLCLGCMETIILDQDIRVPIDPLFTEHAMESAGESVTLDLTLEMPISMDEATEWIASGPDGATLHKEENGFILAREVLNTWS
jgi:hypothetical protein